MSNSNFHIFSYVKYEGLKVPWIHEFWLFPWLGTAKFIWFWTQKFYLLFYNKVLNLELFLRKPKWWVLLFQSGWMIKIHTHRYLEPHALTFLHPSWDKYKQAVHRRTRRSSEKTCSKRKAAYSMPHGNLKQIRILGGKEVILRLLLGFRSLAERAKARSKWAWSAFSHRLMMRHKQSAANTRVAQRGATKGFDLSSSPSVVNMVSSSISSFFSDSSSLPLLRRAAALMSTTGTVTPWLSRHEGSERPLILNSEKGNWQVLKQKPKKT